MRYDKTHTPFWQSCLPQFEVGVKKLLPSKGHIGIMTIIDKQFGMMELFYGKEEKALPDTPQQLELF